MATRLPKVRNRQASGALSSGSDGSGSSHRSSSGRGGGGSGGNGGGSRHASRMLLEANDIQDSFTEDSGIHFQENKHTILSNFEEWIKMATDNKITSKNSWQFALIDYFHDMNVIKDGDTINFQRASATLDGCVKIYLSRVESAHTETGKLLSGLSQRHDSSETPDSEDEEAGDGEGEPTRKTRTYNRVLSSTLAKFEDLRIKKLEKELAIDPLFKRALAEFDEGGAKSLLLNTLGMDSTGRVIFDATSAALQERNEESQASEELDPMLIDQPPIDISSLRSYIFRNEPDTLDGVSICPSLPDFAAVLEDMTKAKLVLGEINEKHMNPPSPLPMRPLDFEPPQFEPDAIPEYDDGNEIGDDENGVANDPADPVDNLHNSIVQGLLNEEDHYGAQNSAPTQIMDRDLMAYFDDKLKANWRGPQHWKVQALLRTLAPPVAKPSTPNPERRKRNEPTIIDFSDPDVDEDELFQPPRSMAYIISKRDDNDDSKNNYQLLPDDFRYNSSRLTNLFTKPQIPIMNFASTSKRTDTMDSPAGLTDENYFADQYSRKIQSDKLAESFHQAENEDYHNDFGGDEYAGVDFNDALELAAPENVVLDLQQAAQIDALPEFARRRPQYVSFSRVAKRVDVKLLKDNLWTTIKNELDATAYQENGAELPHEENEEFIEPFPLTFGEIVHKVGNMYRPDKRKDLSTSFGFICLLHLANEHGFAIESNEQHDDLRIVNLRASHSDSLQASVAA